MTISTSYQFAGYGSFTGANWFADALVAYGRDEFALDRHGVIDVIHGATGADVFTAAAPGRLSRRRRADPRRADRRPRLHPRPHSRLHRDRRQPADHDGGPAVGRRPDRRRRASSCGLHSSWGGNLYSPFVNVTAEQDFLGAGRMVTTTQVTTPLLPVLTPVPSNNRVYGQVAAGVAASLGGNVSASLNAATTFARQGGDDFSASLGIKVAF